MASVRKSTVCRTAGQNAYGWPGGPANSRFLITGTRSTQDNWAVLRDGFVVGRVI